MSTKIVAVPKYPKKHDSNLTLANGATPIPLNYFKKDNDRHVFLDEIEERHAFEQFFWTRDTVKRLMDSCNYTFVERTCCFTTPSLAHEWHMNGRDEVLLDIDDRFSYLPKFKYYDATDPYTIDGTFRLIILDPPFFSVPIEKFKESVDLITGKDYSTRIIISFLKRSEKRLRMAFADYNIRPTKFKLQYSSIKPNKWSNFVLYSNIELPGIKFMKE